MEKHMQNLITEALKNPNTKPTVGPRLDGLTMGDLIIRAQYEKKLEIID